MPVTPFDKAIIAGLTSAILAEAARYGFHATAQNITTLGLVLTAVVPYVIAHGLVYLKTNRAPASKPLPTIPPAPPLNGVQQLTQVPGFDTVASVTDSAGNPIIDPNAPH
jgi:hypothetical protein